MGKENLKISLKRDILKASGKERVEKVFKNGKIVDVFAHTITTESFAVDKERIVGIGTYEGEQEIDLNGNYVIPGLIDSHVHIESSHVLPSQYARVVIPHGTTTIIADPHEIANVLGIEGVKFMLDSSRDIPMNIFFMLPSCVPATSFENAGARLDSGDIEAMMDDNCVLGLGELMDYPSVIAAEPETLNKILTARLNNKIIDGHAPALTGKELNAYIAAGVRTDHECTTVAEMNERLKNGMYILIREGSAAQDLETLLKGITPENSRRCTFCTDDKQPNDLLLTGHIDNHLRIAVEHNIDPITAVQMATINAAECYRLDSTGAVAPGYYADFAVVNNLKDFDVLSVYYHGQKTAENGKPLFCQDIPNIQKVKKMVSVKNFSVDDLKLKLKSDVARVMRLKSRSLITEQVQRRVGLDRDGFFKYRQELDIVKLAVIERHHSTGNIGLGLVENYKLQGGAIASTIVHDSHNIIVIGDNDQDMYLAAKELIRVNGGITLCSQSKILSTLTLPIAGLMSYDSLENVHDTIQKIHEIAFKILQVNSSLDPLMTLSFLALPVIPELKLTDMGLFDVTKFKFTDISVQPHS